MFVDKDMKIHKIFFPQTKLAVTTIWIQITHATH